MNNKNCVQSCQNGRRTLRKANFLSFIPGKTFFYLIFLRVSLRPGAVKLLIPFIYTFKSDTLFIPTNLVIILMAMIFSSSCFVSFLFPPLLWILVLVILLRCLRSDTLREKWLYSSRGVSNTIGNLFSCIVSECNALSQNQKKAHELLVRRKNKFLTSLSLSLCQSSQGFWCGRECFSA